jgi:hypothetical protein
MHINTREDDKIYMGKKGMYGGSVKIIVISENY